MCAHEVRERRTKRIRTEGKTSVVGSTLGDASSRPGSRRLPRGGIKEDGLKVAEGALPDSTIMRQVDAEALWKRVLRTVAIVSGSLLVLVVVGALALTILSHTGMFLVQNVAAQDTEHLTAEEIVRLADVGDGTTLLNVDTAAIEEGVRKNPWVASVEISRNFPDTLGIRVNERKLGTLVSMGTGSTAWLMGDDSVWIEPYPLDIGEGEAAVDVALAQADSLGVILINNVPGSVEPAAGYPTTDKAILAVMSFRDEFSRDFNDQIVSFSAPSDDDISCTLANGVEIALGYPSNIGSKESVARKILSEYEGQVTYVNVRVPSHPTFRRVDSEYVGQGTGATGTSTDPTDFAEINKPTVDPYGYDPTAWGATDDDETNADATADATGTGTGTGTGTDAGTTDTTGSSLDTGSSATMGNGSAYGTGTTGNAYGSGTQDMGATTSYDATGYSSYGTNGSSGYGTTTY